SIGHFYLAHLGHYHLAATAVRAALRLEMRWDTFMYHVPFAARRAGLGIPYESPPYLQACYNGFPPLPELLQGALWRISGSINGTGLLNYLALGLFVFFAWRYLEARLWVLILLCLTAPLVLIHASSSYVDLFSNSLLAIAVSAFLAMLLFDRWMDATLLTWALAGMAAAAWSKYTAMPVIGLLAFGFLVSYWRRRGDPRASRFAGWVLAALLIACVPYAKNWILYHNPTWPGGITALRKYFPSLIDTGLMQNLQSPPPLHGYSQPGLFLHSLFEMGHPTRYPDRERWIIDQGNAWIAYRSGGFWVVGVVTASLAAVLLGFLSARRNGFVVAIALLILGSVVSVLPQSHELRYFQFLPLTVAALVATLLPRVSERFPATTLVILCLILGEFAFISKINRAYYRVERVGYEQAAAIWGVKPFWRTLEPGRTYCAVGFEPVAFLLTGPTMREFHIIDRPDAGLCPPNVAVLRK
ncbi:MAG: hypothetical protein ABJF23_30115, partial [Bryobacteraceae bacterium]